MKKISVPAIIEQHIHGGFGVNFNTCQEEDILYFLDNIKNYGVSKIYPTLHTDSIETLNKQIKIIYNAKRAAKNKYTKIMGVHLEGPFINPKKAGVHSVEIIKKPNLKEYKQIVDGVEKDFVKIVTLAPELDEGEELTDYLNKNGVIVSAGHTLAKNLCKVRQVTHLFNAMGGISHKEKMTAGEALINDNIYAEVIADGNHIIEEVLNLIFKVKPKDKVILISDALPIAHSKNKKKFFMGQEIFLHGDCAKTKEGTLAGCAIFTFEIIKKLVSNHILDIETAFNMASKNISENLKVEHASMLEIDENFKIYNLSD